MKHNFRKMDIWLRSRALVAEIYKKTKGFPPEEKFGLTLQIRRAAVSMPSNIAEGCGRDSDKDTARFMNIVIDSSCELETQLFVSMDLNYIEPKEAEFLVDEVTQIRKMTIGFKNSLDI